MTPPDVQALERVVHELRDMVGQWEFLDHEALKPELQAHLNTLDALLHGAGHLQTQEKKDDFPTIEEVETYLQEKKDDQARVGTNADSSYSPTAGKDGGNS